MEPPRTTAQPDPRSLLGRMRATQQPSGPAESPVIDFGEYAGWRIADVARHDPRYLRWLSRHSSGVRDRKAIELALGTDPEIGRRAAIIF